MEKFPEMFENWFNEITFGDKKNIDSYVQETSSGKGSPEKTEIKTIFTLYTNNYIYNITAIERHPDSKRISYLGCVMNCRKSRPGEDWLRGNDLPDGALNNETWNRIKNAIIRNELVKLESKENEKSI